MGPLALILLIGFSCIHSSLQACDVNENVCTAGLLKNVVSAFSASNISIQDSATLALSTSIANFSARCLNSSQNVLRAVRVLSPTTGDPSQQGLQLRQGELTALFTRSSGYRVEFTPQSPERIAEEVMFQLQTNVSMYDAWILDVPSGEAALRAGGVAGLEGLAAEPDVQRRLQDSDVHPFLRKYGAMYGDRRTGVVLSSVVPLLYWRRDLFAAAGLSGPPATWEELEAAAAALHGRDLDGDGAADAALCWHSEGCIESGIILANILASMTQYQGLSTGWLFRPEDMAPLAAGPPLVLALALLRNLTRMEAPWPETAMRSGDAAAAATRGCAFVHSGFFNGSCALTIMSAQQFKTAQLKYPHLHGLVGVAPLPGSEWVWNRAAAAWMRCGEESPSGDGASPCPYATLEPPLVRSRGVSAAAAANGTPATAGVASRPPPAGTASGGAGGRRRMAAAEPPPPSRRVWVNRSPYNGMTALLGSVDARAPADYGRAALQFFALATDPNNSWVQLGAANSVVGPFRLQHLAPGNVGRWLDMNYSREDLEPFLESYRRALEHPNAAAPLRLPGAAVLRDVLYWATQRVLRLTEAEGAGAGAGGGGPWEALAAEVTSRLVAAVADVGLEPREVQRRYWQTLGYTAPPPPPRGATSWLAGRGARGGVGAAVALGCCAVAALAAAAWWHRRRRARMRRTLFGRAVAPGASPATTLVVTDIVDSTRLWETVSPAAMTRAVQLHHETLRSLLYLHNGYESATEGDAFIMSFYSAADAVAFALRAQAALLYQPWPEELLVQEPCRPQYVVCRGPGGPADRPRVAIPRLTRGSGFYATPDDAAGASGPLWLHRAGGGEEVGSGSGTWLAGSASQLHLHSGKLKLMAGALSLPLKRRTRAAHAGAAAPPLGSSTTPQLTLAPHPPPRDGFVSHSLSQLRVTMRSLGGGGTAATDGGDGGRGVRHLQNRAQSQRDAHRLRQLRLAASRARNANASTSPYDALNSGHIDESASVQFPLAPTSARIAAATTAAAAAAVSLFGGTSGAGSEPVSVGRDGGDGPGGGAAAVAGAKREAAGLALGGFGSSGSGSTALAQLGAAPRGALTTDAVRFTASHTHDLSKSKMRSPAAPSSACCTAPMAAAAALLSPGPGDSHPGELLRASTGRDTRDLTSTGGLFSSATESFPADAADAGGGGGGGAGTRTGGGRQLKLPAGGGGVSRARSLVGFSTEAAASVTETTGWETAESAPTHLSLPLRQLAPGTVAAAADDDDEDDDMRGLLGLRCTDIRSEPDPNPDPGVELGQGLKREISEEAAEEGMAAGSARATRGTPFRLGTSPALALMAMGLASDSGLPSPSADAVAATTTVPLKDFGSGGGGGEGASAVPSGVSFAGVTSGSTAATTSGVLTTSIGLMPYRRTSVPNNLAALMGQSVAGPGFAIESGSATGLTTGGLLGSGGGPLGGALFRTMPLRAYYAQLFRPASPGSPGAVRVAGGLSVRMGVHSGVASTQVSYNRVAGRTQYSGAALEAAKAVCDAAQGGMVLLSRATFEQLGHGRSGGPGGGSGREPPLLVLHAGRHVLKGESQPQDLYMAQSRELLARLASLGPIRSCEEVESGALESPLGEVTLGLVAVVGLPTLMAWDKEATEEALTTFRRVVVAMTMRRLGGHLVEEGPGRVMAAFGHPFDAIRWAAACEALLKEADWSEALLSHELAEEVQGPVMMGSHLDAPVLMGDGELSRMLFRGLRVKGALDCAAVKAELQPATGRMGYRGGLAAAVQRIAAYVSTGQVVATRRAWRAYEAALDSAADVLGAADVVGASLGPHSIRGVGDKVELWSIRLEDVDLMYEPPYEASYRGAIGARGIAAAAAAAGGRRRLAHGPAAADLASPVAALAGMGGDVVGSRLGASLADTMATQLRGLEVTEEDLRRMLSE